MYDQISAENFKTKLSSLDVWKTAAKKTRLNDNKQLQKKLGTFILGIKVTLWKFCANLYPYKTWYGFAIFLHHNEKLGDRKRSVVKLCYFSKIVIARPILLFALKCLVKNCKNTRETSSKKTRWRELTIM